MSISATKSRKKEAEAGLSDDPRQTEITTPNFVLFGETFTFIETFSATVINSDPGNGHIWVKTNTGDEKQISDYGIPFRSSHTIHKYELRQYSEDGSYDAYKDALIVNKKTGEHEINLKENHYYPRFSDNAISYCLHSIVLQSNACSKVSHRYFHFTLCCCTYFISHTTLGI